MPNKTFTCQKCNSITTVPKLIHWFRVPDDYEPIVNLIEAKLNVATCLVCDTPVAIPAPVAVVCHNEETAIILLPRGVDIGNDPQRLIGQDYKVQICDNYYDLYLLILPWLNHYLLPIFTALFSDSHKERTRLEQIELFSPLFIRLFKGYIDGKVPLILQTQGEASPEQVRQAINAHYIPLVRDQLQRIMLEACRTRSLLRLEESIRERIPKDCITPEVLSVSGEICKHYQESLSDTEGFMFGFRQEYLHAVLHSYLGVENPRGVAWGTYIRTVWTLSKNEGVRFDPQFKLSQEILHRTLKFEHLWDASVMFGVTPDTSNIRELGEMMLETGYGDRYIETVTGGGLKFDVADGPQIASLTELLKATSEERCPLNQSAEKSTEFGQSVAINLNILITNSQKDQALHHTREMMSYAMEIGDGIAAVSTASYAAEVLNRYGMNEEAAPLIDIALTLVEEESIHLSRELSIHFWNEVGSLRRYRHQNDEALAAYSHVAGLLDDEPESDVVLKNKRMLLLNIAIVYRQMGRFKESIALLLPLIMATPDNHMLRHTAAVVYSELNLYTEALEHINRAVESTKNDPDVLTRSNYLITRGWLKHLNGDTRSGLADLMKAFQDVPQNMLQLTSRIAAAAMSYTAVSDEEVSFIEQCEGLLIELIGSQEHRYTPSMHVTMLGQLGSRLLRQSRTEEAQAIIEPEIKWFMGNPDRVGTPWDLDHMAGWLYYQLDEREKCWTFIRSAISKLGWRMPMAEDSSFTPFWLQDKETFQQNVASIALDYAEMGIIPLEEMAAVYEIMNGLEIRVKLIKADDPIDLRIDVLDNLRRFAVDNKGSFEVFFFIDTAEQIRVIRFSSETNKLAFVDGLRLTINDVLRIKEKTISALKKANPADLSVLDRKLEPWEQLSRDLGAYIAPLLPPGAHICFLPGRVFTGMPLHLVRMPDGTTLLEHHTVSYSPNSTTLLGERTVARDAKDRTIAVVTVTKERDVPAFKSRAHQGSERLVRKLGQTAKVVCLKEQSGDLDAILEALMESTEIVFICHGTVAGLDKGFGICIASDGHLPPTFLPVSEVPELSRFVLNWRDIDGIESAPDIVVSLACSTGQTQIGRGGVRLGLEQSLFSGGTRLIISPLWDVEQSSALEWVECFYSLRAKHSDWSIEQAAREAALAIKEAYPHPYFWGPYILNGSITRRRNG